MKNRPLIGVTTSEIRHKEAISERTPQADPPQVELALGLDYTRAIERVGGIPVVLPPLPPEAAKPLLDGLDGLCLSGGPDLYPASYGALTHPEAGPFEPDIDRFELAAADAAWDSGLPTLAICRGAQALNVSRNGTLFQHLPDLYLPIEHRQPQSNSQVTHEVEVMAGTLLSRTVGMDRLEVNSFHHQAVDRLGQDLRVSARSSDGMVEAIEAPDRPFVLGVQWHAECIASRPEQAALFESLVEAAREQAPATAGRTA
jgi:putative glutamine amidotransferase